MSNERVLVIDDSRQIIQHLVEQVLPTFGFQPTAALDGREGMNAIRKQKPDLIMLDLNLPHMTGLDILQTMVAEAIDIPVILMTGYGSEKSAVEAFRLGVKDYLIKPFSVDEVVEAINHALTETRLRHDKTQLADQLQRTQAEMRRRMNEISAVLGIGKAVASLLSVDELLDRVLEAAIYLSNAEESAVWLLDPKTSQLHTFANKGGKNEGPQQLDVSNDSSVIGQVLRSGRPLRQSSFTGEGIKVKTGYHARAILYVPLVLRGRALGVLSVLNRVAPRSFSERDEYLVSALADYAAIALQNARTFQETDKALSTGMDSLRSLVQITRALTSSLEMKKVVQLAMQQIHESWQIEASSLWLVDKQSGNLRVLANIGTPTKLLKQISVPLGRGFVGHVAQTGNPIYTNSAANHSLHYSSVDHRTGFRTRSLLCVPLLFGGVAIGALQLLNKLNGEFDEQDLERAMAIATAVAIGVTNANLYRQSELRRRQLEALLQHSPNLILLTDENNRLLLFNQRAREPLALQPDMIGQPLGELLQPPALAGFVIQNSAASTAQTATINLDDGRVWQATFSPAVQFGRVLIIEQLTGAEN